MKTKVALIAALLVAGCQAKAQNPLLASELMWTQHKDGWTLSVELSPALADQPELVRRIRAERIAEMTRASYGVCDPYEEGGIPTCEDSWSYDLRHKGKRLVSLMAAVEFDSGGAHPISSHADYLYDLAAMKKIRFGDIFTSWSEARPLLQSALCEQLHGLNPQYVCPPVEKQGLSLITSTSGTAAGGVRVETQDYAIGSYADGQENIAIDISPALLALIKPEYRSEFLADAVTGIPSPEAASQEASPAPAVWWSIDSSFTECIPSKGPDAKMAEFIGFPDEPKRQDFRGPDGALTKVEIVNAHLNDGLESVWDYYRSESDCLAKR